MKRTTHPVVLTLLVASAVALTAAAGGSAKPEGRTLNLTSVQTSFVPVPAITRKTPPQIGGRMVFGDVLYNRGAQFGKPDGARVGTAENICTFVSTTAMQCTITAHLPNGQIVLGGAISKDSKQTTFAVTGGVGAFASARGSATGRDLSPTKSLVSLHLNP